MRVAGLMNISLEQIVIFIKAAKYNNFSKVAQELYLSPSVVSKRITSLEKDTGLCLFVRDKNKISLTPAGNYLYSSWRDFAPEVERSLVNAHRIQSGIESVLTIGIGDSVNPGEFLVDPIHAFVSSREQVETVLETRGSFNLLDDLVSNHFDVIFLPLYRASMIDNHSMLRYEKIISCPHYAGMSPNNPLAKKESLEVNDLRKQNFWMPRVDVYPAYRDMVIKLCEGDGFTPQILQSNGNTIYSIAGNNDIIIVDEYYHDFNNPYVVYKKIENTESGIIMAWNEISYQRKRDFVEYLSDYFASEETRRTH